MKEKERQFNNYINGEPYTDGRQMTFSAEGEETYDDVRARFEEVKKEMTAKGYWLTYIEDDVRNRKITGQFKKAIKEW